MEKTIHLIIMIGQVKIRKVVGCQVLDMYFNTRDGDGSYDNSGYWAEVAVIDGSALTPTSFGEYDEIVVYGNLKI